MMIPNRRMSHLSVLALFRTVVLLDTVLFLPDEPTM